MQPLTADQARPRLPPSVTHFGLNTIAIAVVIGVLYAIRAKALRVHDPVLAVCAAYVVPVVLFDLLILRVHRRATTGIDWDKPFTPDAARIATKLLGLAVTLAPFASPTGRSPSTRARSTIPSTASSGGSGPVVAVGRALHGHARREPARTARRVLEARSRLPRPLARRRPRRDRQPLPRMAHQGVLLRALLGLVERQHEQHSERRPDATRPGRTFAPTISLTTSSSSSTCSWQRSATR